MSERQESFRLDQPTVILGRVVRLCDSYNGSTAPRMHWRSAEGSAGHVSATRTTSASRTTVETMTRRFRCRAGLPKRLGCRSGSWWGNSPKLSRSDLLLLHVRKEWGTAILAVNQRWQGRIRGQRCRSFLFVPSALLFKLNTAKEASGAKHQPQKRFQAELWAGHSQRLLFGRKLETF